LHPTLSSLIALQALDTAADQTRRRLADLPAAEQAIAAAVDTARADVTGAKARLQENAESRRALERDVAAVDSRLSRFDDHKAAVKTNQEYTALLHEISVGKAEKDSLEERLLVQMEDADRITAELKAAEAALAAALREGETARAGLIRERQTLSAELERLTADRARELQSVPAALVNKYDQLLRQRRGVAVVSMAGDICTACHVRLRPHVAQQIRRNDEIVQCESCQRILYYTPPAQAAGSALG
jgi:predicted  nucleic acid-binding Zn-ribbon protein